MSIRSLALRAAAPLLIAATALTGTSPAQAKSAALDYTCDFFAENGAVADVGLTLNLDTDLKNGGTIAKGATVTPTITGTVILSSALSDLMIEVAGKSDNWQLQNAIGIAETRTTFGADFEPQRTPANTAIPIHGASGSFVATGSDTFTIAAGTKVTMMYPVGEPPVATVKCDLNKGQDRTIDRVHVAKVAPKPATPAPSPTAARPAVVQTDVAQADVVAANVVLPQVAQADAGLPATDSSLLPLAAAGAGSILLLGAGAAAIRRRNN